MSTNPGIKNLRGAPLPEPIPATDLPEAFAALDTVQQKQLLAWVAQQPSEALCTWMTTDQTLANRFYHQRADRWLPCSGQMKAAMLQSGYRPRPGERRNRNWTWEAANGSNHNGS